MRMSEVHFISQSQNVSPNCAGHEFEEGEKDRTMCNSKIERAKGMLRLMMRKRK